MIDFTIEEIPAPRSLDGDEGVVFAAMIEIRNVCEVAGYGTEEVASPPAEMLPFYVDEHETLRVAVARADDRIVGTAVHQVTDTTPQTAWTDLRVLPDFRGGGIGRALADALENFGRESGQSNLTSYVVHRDAPGAHLSPPTGFGSIPADDRGVRFLLERGWTLEQVARGSRFALPGNPALLAEKRADAEQHSRDYRIVSWVDTTPEEYLDDTAVLNTRMSTDAPHGGIDSPEDLWDADRLRTHEAAIVSSPQRIITSAAQHLPSGRLAGYTRFIVPTDVTRPVNQWATIVLEEHRGHRLGMLLKVANLELLDEQLPGHPSVLTWNAEENRYMLSVNEAVGFERIGDEGVWRKDL